MQNGILLIAGLEFLEVADVGTNARLLLTAKPGR